MFLQKLCAQHEIHLPLNLQQQLLQAQNEASNLEQACYRFMTDEEIEEMFKLLGEIEVFKGILALWADHQSNYVGIYYEGPFVYRVCYISHEETDLSPGYRSVTSFLSAIEETPDAEWEELVKDYPSQTYISAQELEQDLQAIANVQQLLTQDTIDEDVRCQWVFSLMAVTPSTHSDIIHSFVEDEDMFVKERAQELIKKHRSKRA